MAVIVQLQRAGDVINVLPLAYYFSTKIGRVNWVVSRDHASILEGASYVNPIPWDGGHETLLQAIRHYQNAQPIVTQAHHNPDDRRLTESFSLEQWRYAGALDQKNKWPLIFDKRDSKREAALVAKHIPANRTRPVVLVATTSISTRFPHANKLIASIRGMDVEAIDMNDVKAERIYDLIALYDAADCLVSVDTSHVHLARASNCPLVALLNDGWYGAVPPPQAIFAKRYSEIGDDMSPVVEAVEKQLARKAESVAVVISSYPQGHTDRHRRAMATHPFKDTIYATFDHRPKMKELFEKALATGKDICVMTNDDVSFPEGSIDKIREHARKWDFGCSRRPPEPNVHIGREIFFFRSDWLKRNWSHFPECYWTVQKPDLLVAKWMRRMRGIETTMENLSLDFPPVELPAGIIEHEFHPSHWANAAVENSPEGQWNDKLWREMA